MKIILNRCFGVAQLSDSVAELLNLNSVYGFDPLDIATINLVEQYGEEASGNLAKLEVHEIPDDATDWLLETYDGYERAMYVLDGKIHII